MITITSYLENIAKDFEAYLDEGHDLCNLKGVTFAEGKLPDYSDPQQQQFYLMHYAYGYAFEYKTMYNKLFDYFPPDSGQKLKVTSIGCGTMLDYWSLRRALAAHSKDGVKVDYTGIDLVNWNYRMEAQEGDSVEFIQNDVCKELSGRKELDSDIYIFPKSISEFSYTNFRKLVSVFQSVPITKDRIFFLISVRANELNQIGDCEKIDMLGRAVAYSNQKYMYKYRRLCSPLQKEGENIFGPVQSPSKADKEQSISRSDPRDFDKYPPAALALINYPYPRCPSFQADKLRCKNCANGRKLDRIPIQTQSQVCYVILPFEKSK